MRRETAKTDEIIDLAAYRAGKRRAPKIPTREPRPTPEDAEEALNEIARHLLMAVRVITARKN